MTVKACGVGRAERPAAWRGRAPSLAHSLSIALEAPIPKMSLGDKTSLYVIYVCDTCIHIYIYIYIYMCVLFSFQTSSNFRTILVGR